MVRHEYSERHRTQRSKNKLLLIALLSVCAVIYLVFIIRAGAFG